MLVDLTFSLSCTEYEGACEGFSDECFSFQQMKSYVWDLVAQRQVLDNLRRAREQGLDISISTRCADYLAARAFES